jgi:kynurenine formamidase
VTVEENGYYSQKWTFGEHTGTHLDAPGHFVADGARVDELPVDALVGPAVVIDISERAAENPDAWVTVEDIEAWESENGEIPEGAFVFMYSGWESRVDDDAAYINDMHFPGFSPEAAEFLVTQRNLRGVGVDTLSLDYGQSQAFEAHFHFLSAGLVGVENLANLMEIKGKQATVILGIPTYQEGSGGPLRVIALVEE